MLVYPNVKINLGLFITGKRPDGYHNIESVFYPISWTESLEVIQDTGKSAEDYAALSFAEKGNVRFFSYNNPIPGTAESNLCIKVFELVEAWFNLPKTEIHLLKSLPIGAGLGGGSADAAFTLRALKDYYNLTISDFEAKELLAKVGSDCPFFWNNKPAFVFGRGEQMRALELDLSHYHFVLVNPNIHVSTKEAYSGVSPKNPPIDLAMLEWLDVADWKDLVKNDFEDSLFPSYPEIAAIKSKLYELGATYASMTGSGSTVYGMFSSAIELPKEWEQYQVWKSF
ncbi:MAG: 4-(cytidine 5'-diphospho)-2-C-methyl-D-erythritol kinase [Salibacteraceae bacterium]|jgi:4-diphosphocytidyl-2-C-methyl-D-erythritol kinase|nr:4-(cytidine 5'-diphospho)-2-C-methyl-D-erythritol kinase [Salibacteraceae bacterium]MDP4762551.1 4-(cytidine 5'-diphospho)-2-C-methyl-D-erythritol kinase [Salibacteraceae bacterium]MDP4844590.1 4-(cytidine 5'-diphospho)-2-C-methyl-D-erythritol kinase [Salibacteraceae bacterium]